MPTPHVNAGEDEKRTSVRLERFIRSASLELNVSALDRLPPVTDQPPEEAARVRIADPSQLTVAEIEALFSGFGSRFGMVAFETGHTVFSGQHPLCRMGAQLRDVIPSRWPVFSSSDEVDGTTKIRDVADPNLKSRSLSSQAMAAHQDGWLSLRGKPGILAVTGLWAENAPVESAATFSQNMLRLALELLRSDEAAFAALLADDAVSIVGRSGEIAAISPVLFLGPGNRTQTFYRGSNDEYQVIPGTNDPANRRAVDFLNCFVSPGANGSVFSRLDRPGRGLLLNNRHCVHGRTRFTDGEAPGQKRVIASKWWASDDEHRTLVWD